MNNPPKQFCKWSFEQGDQKWQQDELEHEFEQWNDFFWRKKKWMGAGISEGDPCGAHKPPRHAQGVGVPCGLVAHWCCPLVCFQCQKF